MAALAGMRRRRLSLGSDVGNSTGEMVYMPEVSTVDSGEMARSYPVQIKLS